MVFSKLVGKTLLLYTDASRADITDCSVKDGKLRSSAHSVKPVLSPSKYPCTEYLKSGSWESHGILSD